MFGKTSVVILVQAVTSSKFKFAGNTGSVKSAGLSETFKAPSVEGSAGNDD